MRLPIFSRAIGIVSAALAIATGVVVALGYFLDIVELVNLRLIFVQWAVLLAAAALLVGIINLARVHFGKVRKGGLQAIYSLVLLGALVVTFVLGTVFGPDASLPLWIFNNIQVPVETSLMALLAVTLAFAGARLLQRRANTFTVLFLITAFFALLGTGSFPWGDIPLISDTLRPWLVQVPAAAGARGILLGIALGTVATSLRILLGVDRPYGG
jgi:hypothetical protein